METYPKFEEFKDKVSLGNLIPVYREILADMDTPVSAFSKFRDSRYAVLLESIEGGEKWARYSFISFDPTTIIKAKGSEVEIERGGETEKKLAETDSLELVKEELDKFKPVDVDGLPRFFGGAVGFLSYDIVKSFENIPNQTADDLDLPDLVMMITEKVLIFDNVSNKIKVVANAFVPGGASEQDIKDSYDRAVSSIEQTIEKLRSPAPSPRFPEQSSSFEKDSLHPVSDEGFEGVFSNMPKDVYKDGVEKGIEYVRSGDAIQVVLSQRFSKDTNADPFSIYRSLRTINPSPYMFYLQFEDLFVAGSSPEVLVRLEDEQISVRPIAGTRKRGADSKEDEALAEDLLGDPKEIAEHVMLVDLGRNDVGKVAKTASVSVNELMVIEKYSHVMHIVSNVQAQIKEEHDMYDVLRSCFPAGTLSGAPKIRAMEIIEEIEPTARGLYGGSIGFFSFSGAMDMCITIRTVVVHDGIAHVQAGAGVVSDSIPESEYQETINKARGMMKAISIAESGI